MVSLAKTYVQLLGSMYCNFSHQKLAFGNVPPAAGHWPNYIRGCRHCVGSSGPRDNRGTMREDRLYDGMQFNYGLQVNFQPVRTYA